MNKKAMFSQPMNGLSDEEIIKTREKAMAFLESKGYEVVNTFFTAEWYSKEK
nr:MAG: Nucleoside 2-deoxyribosyltransferase like protein [Bacteriophage sp.]